MMSKTPYDEIPDEETDGSDKNNDGSRFLKFTGAVLFLCIVLVLVSVKLQRPNGQLVEDFKEESDSSLPNFVFLLADDLGWNSIGYENYDLYFATPNLDSLARQGIVMQSYYALEVCTPSRASLLTGRYPLNIGMQYGVVEADVAWGMPLEETTIAEVLKDSGYKTHGIGKWHIGHHSPMYLPTARGFDSFTGFMDGENYYYSKRAPMTDNMFFDFLTMNSSCYSTYEGTNMHNYSTHLYRDWAVEIIETHDQSDPLFLYMSFQAVHTPFTDVNDDREPELAFMSTDIYDKIMSDVVGVHRQLYAMTLNIMDSAVGDIVAALNETGMLDNTYVIFASDNGACYKGGGKNGPLRGTKLTMLEGGTKVDSFIYSPMLFGEYAGSLHTGMMHVSDWFPTMLDLAGITYDPPSGYELDGVSQLVAWGKQRSARQYMLYNSYSNVKVEYFSIMENGGFAIRNIQYKLIHFWNNSDYSTWHQYSDIQADDDVATNLDGNCAIEDARIGQFTPALFDLINDPYEKNNLFDDEELTDIKEDLYKQINLLNNRSTEDMYKTVIAETSYNTWKAADDYLVPWVMGDNKITKDVDKSYPSYCGASTQRLTGLLA